MNTKRIKKHTENTNILNKYINNVMPKLINEIEKGIKLNKDNELFKVYKDKFNDILNKNKPSNIRVYISTCVSTTYIKFDIHYPDNENEQFSSHTYIKKDIALFMPKQYWKEGEIICSYDRENIKLFPFNKLQYHNYNNVVNAINKINKINEQKSLLNDKISKIKSKYNNFIINRYI
tara:strand:- start:479 stop:1009 length:531 start_codon:yes stop_codon:yes gene_type:complete